MLRRYPDPEPGSGFALVAFSVFMRCSPGVSMFPLDAFTVHSVPFLVLVNWFEEILGGATGSRGVRIQVTRSGPFWTLATAPGAA